MSRYLLKSLEEAGQRLKDRPVSLFLDYDGTLTPITGRPEDAHLSYPMREILRNIAAAYPSAIISGRSLSDLRALAGLEGFTYAGNHGLEVWSQHFTMVFDIGKAAREELESLRSPLSRLTARFKGVIFEDKGLTLTTHYRLLGSRDFPLFNERFLEAVNGAIQRGFVRLSQSKKAFEIRANVSWDKGKAIEWLLDRPRFRDTVPVCLGDDETDRDSYRAVRSMGISVNIGGVSEDSDFYLLAQEEVKVFLRWLLHHPSVTRDWFGEI